MKRRRKMRKRSAVSGALLWALRRGGGISGNELAKEMKASQAHVSQVEKGKVGCTKGFVERAKSAAVRIAERRLGWVKKCAERLDEIELRNDQLDMGELWGRGAEQERLWEEGVSGVR